MFCMYMYILHLIYQFTNPDRTLAKYFIHHFLTGNLILALFVDWPLTSSNCDIIVDVCDWSIMPCGNGCLLHPDANTDHVRSSVL